MSSPTLAGIESLAIRAAKGEIRWCNYLAEKHLRLNSPQLEWLWSSTDEDTACRLPARKMAGLGPVQHEVADYFSRFSCLPYHKWWDAEMDQCGGETFPTWCDDEDGLYAHSGLKRYFSQIVREIQISTNPDLRFNLMHSLTALAGAHVITEYPRESIEGLYVQAFRPFLEHAAPADVVFLCARLQRTWIGLVPELSQDIHNYISRNGLSGSREALELENMLKNRFQE